MTFPLLIGGAPSRYRSNQSLRFRASNSAHLSRTPGVAGNRKTWTWSAWVKRGALGAGATRRTLFSTSNGAADSSTLFSLRFGDSDELWVSNWGAIILQSTARYRDVTGWYHIVCAFDTTQASATNRCRIYVNGVEVTSWATDLRSGQFGLNSDQGVNGAWAHNIGRDIFDAAHLFDGYMAEVNFIDGQQLTPSNFGQFDPSTNSWVPRRYTGTYGTNGFYLPFNDAASTTTISQDRSGNGNNWTSSGISVTSGVTFDQMLDSPTNNFCTWSPLKQSGSGLATLSAANLRLNGGSGESAIGTQGMSSGKWYWEVVYSTLGTTPDVGIIQLPGDMNSYPAGQKHYVYRSDGNKRSDGPGPVAYGASWTSGDVIGIAFDADAGSITFYKNNVSQGVAFSGISSSEYPFFPCASVSSSTGDVNFGQRPFAYTPPTGFVALNTANLSTPTIQRGDDAFQATLRTGTGASASVSSLRFQPDLLWIKSRSNATNHNLFDAVRGVQNGLVSNSTAAEYADANSLTAFNSNGYSLGTDGSSRGVNINTNTYVDWAWREGAAYGFDIVTYTGTGSARTVAHGLNAVPHMMIVKPRGGTTANGWRVYHRSLANTQYLQLNSTAAADTYNDWNNTTPTSSVFSVNGTPAQTTNENGTNYVAYLWTSISGFSLFGSYQGNGSSDGPFVWCGFRPRFILIKNITGATSWMIYDAARNTFNVVDLRLAPDAAASEAASGAIDITANGFKFRANDANTNGGATNYIFAAFAEHPFKFANAR